MKTVRYLAGAVGIAAPAAFAAGLPATAAAATAPNGAAQQPTAVPLNTGCTGSKYWSVKSLNAMGHVNQKLWFWTRDLTPNICVGTVEDSTHVYGGTTGHQFRLRIYSSNSGRGWRRVKNAWYNAAIKNNSYLQATISVHSSWRGHAVQVCGGWGHSANSSVQLGPTCRVATYTH